MVPLRAALPLSAPHGLAALHDSRVMNNHPNEWREIGLVLNTHVLELSLIKPPSVQGKAEASRSSKARELAALGHGLICSLLGHLRAQKLFPLHHWKTGP